MPRDRRVASKDSSAEGDGGIMRSQDSASFSHDALMVSLVVVWDMLSHTMALRRYSSIFSFLSPTPPSSLWARLRMGGENDPKERARLPSQSSLRTRPERNPV